MTGNLLKLFFQTLLQRYTIKILLTLIRVFYDYFRTDNPDLHAVVDCNKLSTHIDAHLCNQKHQFCARRGEFQKNKKVI